jgi:hypothetical protein
MVPAQLVARTIAVCPDTLPELFDLGYELFTRQSIEILVQIDHALFHSQTHVDGFPPLPAHCNEWSSRQRQFGPAGRSRGHDPSLDAPHTAV